MYEKIDKGVQFDKVSNHFEKKTFYGNSYIHTRGKREREREIWQSNHKKASLFTFLLILIFFLILTWE